MACEAWAWAHLGRSEAVSRALDQAGELVENQHQATPPLFGHAELAGISGACFEVLACKCDVTKAGEYADRASAYITVALNGRERFYVRSRVLDLLGLANVRLTQGEPAEAVRTARMAMECAHGLRSVRVSRQLHRFAVDGLEKFPRSTDVGDFAEQVRATIPSVL